MLVVFFGLAERASAQDPPAAERTATTRPDSRAPRPLIEILPYAVMIGGNAADLWTTQTALDTGQAHEGNPAWTRRGIGQLTVVKTCGVVAIAVVMRVLETHGHPKAARILGYVDGGVTLGVAAHNRQVAR